MRVRDPADSRGLAVYSGSSVVIIVDAYTFVTFCQALILQNCIESERDGGRLTNRKWGAEHESLSSGKEGREKNIIKYE